MTYQEYQQLFEEILNSKDPQYPYDNEQYHEYAKLNRSRMKRWDRQLNLTQELIEKLTLINSSQLWIILTEPWCGDAAHILPLLIQMTEKQALITYDIHLRDSEPFLINFYLTNGAKSIPKLIVRNDQGDDLFNWGPRPKQAQNLIDAMKSAGADFENIKISLQHWYNQDKGKSLCFELDALLDEILDKR